MIRTRFSQAWRLAAAATLVVAVSAQGSAAFAQPSSPTGAVSAEVIIVLGSESQGPTDPAVAQEPVLANPVFQQFRSMRILARPQISLTLNRLVEVPLPNGRKLQLTLTERRADGRCLVRVSIPRYLPSAIVELSRGTPFFQAGQAYQNGRLVLALRIR